MVVEEIERVKVGSAPGELPVGGLISHVTARCPGNSAEVLERAREVLLSVLQGLSGTEEGASVSDLIPRWFIDECASGAGGWTLQNWLHWFTDEDRQWFWWDVDVVSSEVLDISIVTEDWPVPVGSFEWMLRASGATEVEFDF